LPRALSQIVPDGNEPPEVNSTRVDLERLTGGRKSEVPGEPLAHGREKA
jgi:hypothetical protein